MHSYKLTPLLFLLGVAAKAQDYGRYGSQDFGLQARDLGYTDWTLSPRAEDDDDLFRFSLDARSATDIDDIDIRLFVRTLLAEYDEGFYHAELLRRKDGENRAKVKNFVKGLIPGNHAPARPQISDPIPIPPHLYPGAHQLAPRPPVARPESPATHSTASGHDGHDGHEMMTVYLDPNARPGSPAPSSHSEYAASHGSSNEAVHGSPGPSRPGSSASSSVTHFTDLSSVNSQNGAHQNPEARPVTPHSPPRRASWI